MPAFCDHLGLFKVVWPFAIFRQADQLYLGLGQESHLSKKQLTRSNNLLFRPSPIKLAIEI